jgi:transposase
VRHKPLMASLVERTLRGSQQQNGHQISKIFWVVKAALLAEIEAEGSRVTLVARRHRISESLLYNWRAARKAAVAAANGIEPPEFLQLGVVGQPGVDRSGISTISSAGMIEVDLPSGVRFRVDASVSEKALTRVLRAMKGMV